MNGTNGHSNGTESSQQLTTLAKDTEAKMHALAGRVEFERKHRAFLIAAEDSYFVNIDGTIIFFNEYHDEVKQYFGGEGWRLLNGEAVQKQVDGMTVRLLVQNNEEIEL